jgi:hypothetical protein
VLRIQRELYRKQMLEMELAGGLSTHELIDRANDPTKFHGSACDAAEDEDGPCTSTQEPNASE